MNYFTKYEHMRTDLTIGSTHVSEIVDECKLFVVSSVTDYSYTFGKWTIDADGHSVSTDTRYLIIDTLYHEAFGHWVYESAIYLPIFLKLKTLYPTIKLVLKGRRTFKDLFLRYFGVSEDDVVYNMLPGNTCLFPEPISSLNTQDLTDQYKALVTGFYTWFDCRMFPDCTSDYVILPRQSRENFWGNPRQYNFTRIIDMLKDRSILLETDTIVNLEDQIDTIRRGKFVIVSDGSPFLVNGMFCRGRIIYNVDADMTPGQRRLYPKKEFIIQIIESRNTVITVDQITFLEKYIGSTDGTCPIVP